MCIRDSSRGLGLGAVGDAVDRWFDVSTDYVCGPNSCSCLLDDGADGSFTVSQASITVVSADGRTDTFGPAEDAPARASAAAFDDDAYGEEYRTLVLGEAAPPIESRLRNDDDGLRRHVLEAVSGGLIARREVTAAFDGALDAGPPLRWLAARGFLRPGGANWKDPPGEAPSVLLDDTWEPTPLGAAPLAAGLGPAAALEVAAALRCRHGVDYGGVAPEYALLHRLYLTAPLQQNVLGGLAHWAAFGDALKDAGKGAREVFKLCGGCEAHVARRAQGLAATAKSEAKNVPGTPDRVCRRFALALLLHDRIGSGPGHHQGPVPQEDGTWGRNQTSSGTPSFAAAFAARYREHAGPDASLTKCEGGDVDNYSRDAATLARRLEYFCRKLAWHEAARACKSARSLLARGAPDELVRLMRASPGNITRARARALHDVGFESAADLAEADATDISAALYLSLIHI